MFFLNAIYKKKGKFFMNIMDDIFSQMTFEELESYAHSINEAYEYETNSVAKSSEKYSINKHKY